MNYVTVHDLSSTKQLGLRAAFLFHRIIHAGKMFNKDAATP